MRTAPSQIAGRARRFVVLVALSAGALLPAAAQITRDPPRSVSGSVTDAGNEPLRGAVVQIEAVDTMVIQTYVTDERGIYHFKNLRPDANYTLWATFRGNRSKSHDMSKFDHKADRDIPIVIVLEK